MQNYSLICYMLHKNMNKYNTLYILKDAFFFLLFLAGNEKNIFFMNL